MWNSAQANHPNQLGMQNPSSDTMCFDVNGFEPASSPYKHVQLRHCSGNGNQQFYQDGNLIKWQQNPSWCLSTTRPDEKNSPGDSKIVMGPCSEAGPAEWANQFQFTECSSS